LKAIELAMVAAPFVAAGMDPVEAIARARSLIDQAEADLEVCPEGERWIDGNLVSANRFTLEDTLGSLGIRDVRTLKRYFRAIAGEATFSEWWPRAVKGEPVFRERTIERMRQIQEERLSKKNQNGRPAVRRDKNRST